MKDWILGAVAVLAWITVSRIILLVLYALAAIPIIGAAWLFGLHLADPHNFWLEVIWCTGIIFIMKEFWPSIIDTLVAAVPVAASFHDHITSLLRRDKTRSASDAATRLFKRDQLALSPEESAWVQGLRNYLAEYPGLPHWAHFSKMASAIESEKDPAIRADMIDDTTTFLKTIPAQAPECKAMGMNALAEWESLPLVQAFMAMRESGMSEAEARAKVNQMARELLPPLSGQSGKRP